MITMPWNQKGYYRPPTAKNSPKHNHVWVYTEGYLPLGECPRCDFLRAAAEAEGKTQHNHPRQSFGRRVEGCPRCNELDNGADKREGFDDHKNKLDRERSEEIRRHFADPNSACDHMTCFQW